MRSEELTQGAARNCLLSNAVCQFSVGEDGKSGCAVQAGMENSNARLFEHGSSLFLSVSSGFGKDGVFRVEPLNKLWRETQMRTVVRRLNDVVAGRFFHGNLSDAVSDEVAGEQKMTSGVFQFHNQTVGVFGGEQVQNAAGAGMKEFNDVLL